MYEFGWQRPRFLGSALGAFGAPSPALGQFQQVAWRARAQAAVGKFDDLLRRIATIGDAGARDALMAWIGSPTQPGTPAERYKVVVDDLAQGTSWNDISEKRLLDLEGVVSQLEAEVSKAEQSYPAAANPNPPGAIRTDRGYITATGLALGALGLLGLVALPIYLAYASE
jgi:hypothetical protein